jgi:hypothetical protein
MEQENIKESSVVSHTIESYAVFFGVDRTILEANRFLDKHEFTFVRFNLAELEEQFSDLFLMPQHFESRVKVNLQHGLSITNEFFIALQNSRLLGSESLANEEVFFLKSKKTFEQKIINNEVNSDILLKKLMVIKNFVASLVQQFRLFNLGDLGCSTHFLIRKDTRFVISQLSNRNSVSQGGPSYGLNTGEAEAFGRLFTSEFIGNRLTDLAIANFNLAYEISDPQTKYVTLMTCLESLFNRGSSQITHIVARHLSLIISTNEVEFSFNYRRTKDLYNIRSAIVHGGTFKEDLNLATIELQEKVRKAINYCLTLQIDKDELFNKLNANGFSQPVI